jgi:hypothetical protein
MMLGCLGTGHLLRSSMTYYLTYDKGFEMPDDLFALLVHYLIFGGKYAMIAICASFSQLLLLLPWLVVHVQLLFSRVKNQS